ncbi:TetR/AcrR family transcriptional regulator [Streptomyces sp. NBC_00063]|uniref:TetR/AcrR family transcriptional regulator n=1 Tax=Streptomyces sp. NBC_00063 TaxID=2975638 RepID=UPI003D758192
MTEADGTRDSARSGRSQARGRERREHLLAAASRLLAERDLDEISLQDLAQAAGIPTSSAYHFYANAMDAFAALAKEISADLAAALTEPIPASRLVTWEDVFTVSAGRAVDFYASRPDARQLLIGSKTPPQFKRADRENDRMLGQVLRGHLAAAFRLPAMERDEEVYFHAVEIIDLFYSLSMLRDGEITDEMAEEALRAGIAYLRTYLPARLPRQDDPGAPVPS